MNTEKKRYNQPYDLTNCAAEPLRFIRACQEHAYLLVCYLPDLQIKAFSENCRQRFAVTGGLKPGLSLTKLLPAEILNRVQDLLVTEDFDSGNPIHYYHNDGSGKFHQENLLVHKSGNLLLLEIEERHEAVTRSGFLEQVDDTVHQIQGAAALGKMLDVTVKEVKKLTGYDRVWLYEFDENYDGTVVAEAVEEGMPKYLHLRYPHTDIPEQARQLYLKQQIRHIISSAEDSDVLLISDDEAPIDLTSADNRAVSPIHLEYLRNMGVEASMSIALVVDGKLWGLIACHHRAKKLIDYRIRNILGFLGRVVSGHLALHQSTTFEMGMLKTNLIRSRLLQQMNETRKVEGLLSKEQDVLKLTNATGFALVLNKAVHVVGNCPLPEEITMLTKYLDERGQNVYHTHQLFSEFPPSQQFAGRPAGLISARITVQPGEYLMWFRPEEVETVTWAGRPAARKIIEGGTVRLHPELSFAKWEASVAGKSIPWAGQHINIVKALRNDIKEIVLLRFQEVKGLNEQLVTAYEELESFSYTVSHDLRAPLRSIKGYVKILQEDYSNGMDAYGQDALDTIIGNVGKMNQFITDMLHFSRLGKATLRTGEVSLSGLIKEVWKEIQEGGSTGVRLQLDIQADKVPSDFSLIRQVILNLLTNAVKYSRKVEDAWVRVSSYTEKNQVIIAVADNGIGFDMKYAEHIFVVFNRLVSDDLYEGTGVGLAVVKRIVEKHHGSISVESKPGEGTVFYIRIPTDLENLLTLAD